MKTPDEIKKGLKCCGCHALTACNENCPYWGDCGSLEEDALAYIQQLEAQIPRWIPVEERLPEVEKRVLLLTERKSEFSGKIYPNITCGFYEDGKMNTENSKAYWDVYELDLEYNEELDAYLVPEGWVEECLEERDEITCMVLGYKVTHWMPIPEPPVKEE